MLLRRAVLIVAITALAALLSPLSAQAAPKGGSGATCNLPESDAEALVILNNYYFAWALEGSDPYPPAEGPYVCDTAA